MKPMHDDELKEEYTESDLKDGVRGTQYRNYHVREYADGGIEMLPQELVDVSARTVEMIHSSIENLNKGS